MGDWPSIGLKPFFDTVLGVDSVNLAVTGIPQDAKYRNLAIELSVRGSIVATVDYLYMTINSDTAANYDYQRLQSSAGGAAGAESLGGTSVQVGFCPGANATALRSASTIVNFPNYKDTTFDKAYISRSSAAGGTTTGTIFVGNWGGTWRSTAAVTNLSFFLSSGNLLTGSRFTAYVY